MAPQPFSSEHQTQQESTEDTSALLMEPTGWVLLLGSFLFCQRTGLEAPTWCLPSEWLTRTLFIKGAPQYRVGRGRLGSFSTSQGSGLGETESEDGLGGGSCPEALWRKVSWKERYFLSLGKFPGPRETEHASRTGLRHETEVTERSHVEMPLNRGVTGQGQHFGQEGE